MSAFDPVRPQASDEDWQTLVCQPALAELIFYPSRYLHVSWRGQFFPPDLGDAMWTCAAAHEHLSAHLRQAVPDPAPILLKHMVWTVALLPSSQLQRLVQHLGALAMRQEIRSIMNRDSVQGILDQIGSELYDFAVRRAGLIHPQMSLLVSGMPGEQPDIGVLVRRAGYGMLARYIGAFQSTLWGRVKLKLEIEHDDAMQSIAMDDNTLDHIVPRILREMD